MSSNNPETSLRGGLLALIGILVLSFDALLVRLAAWPAVDVAFWRGALIAVALALVQLLRGRGLWPSAVQSPAGLAAVALFGLNTVLFVLSLGHTAVANTIILLSLSPLFATLMSRLVTGERPRTDTWVTVGATAAGVFLVVGGSLGSARWVGDALALLASVVLAGALTALRSQPDLERIPVVMYSGVVTAILCAAWSHPLALAPAGWVPVGIMGLVQIPLAMVLLAVATRHAGAPEVSLIMLLEILLGPLWVWLVLAEAPPMASIYGGGVVLAALGVYFGRREACRVSGYFCESALKWLRN